MDTSRGPNKGMTMKPGVCSCGRRNCHNTTTKCGKELPVPRGSHSTLCAECASNHVRQNAAKNARRYRAKNHETYRAYRRRYEQSEERKKKKKESRKPPSDETRKKDRERYHANLAKNRRRRRASYYKHRLKRMAETRARYARQRELAPLGKILEKLKGKPVSWRLLIPLVLLDPTLTKAKAQQLAGPEAKMTARQMTRLGDTLREWLPSWPGFAAKIPGMPKPRN